MALGLEEGEGHAAADQQVVGASQQVVDDSQLVGDLRAAQDHHVGALGGLGEGLQHADLGGNQVALVGRKQRGDVEHRGVLAVHRTEGVVHVGAVFAGQRGKLGCEFGALRRILGGFARVEAHVFQHQHGAVGQFSGKLLGRIAHDIAGNTHVESGELGKLGGGGGDRVLGIRFALGAAQVSHHDDAGAGLGQLLHHGDGGAYTPIVGDGNAIERHVQVATDQNAPPEDTVGE